MNPAEAAMVTLALSSFAVIAGVLALLGLFICHEQERSDARQKLRRDQWRNAMRRMSNTN